MAQVTWAKERREIIERIVKSVAPDVYPDKPLRLHKGSMPLHLLSGTLETRLFQVFTGPLAGAGAPQFGVLNGNTMMKLKNWARIDIRYAAQRGLGDFLMDTNDMSHSDSEKILWTFDPQVSGALWGLYAPDQWEMTTLLVDNSPETEERGALPWVIMRMFFQLQYNVGRNDNY